MRGEKQRPITYLAATIVDDEGTPKYHVVPSRLIVFGILSMGLLLIIATILGFLVLRNKMDIDDIRNRIKVEEQK